MILHRILNWIVYALAIIIAAYILPGVTVETFIAALVTALVLGLINTFVRPVLVLLTLPINLITLGLFVLVINAALILFAGYIVPGFEVASFWWALLFSLVLTVFNWALNLIFQTKN